MKKGSIVSWQINTHCPAKNLNTDIRVTRFGAKQGGALYKITISVGTRAETVSSMCEHARQWNKKRPPNKNV